VGLYSKEHKKYQNLNMGVQWLLMIMIVEKMYVQEYQQQINLTRVFKNYEMKIHIKSHKTKNIY
jgi:hypothetical protein